MQVSVGAGDGGSVSESETEDDRGEFETEWDVGGASSESAAGKKGAAASGVAKRGRK